MKKNSIILLAAITALAFTACNNKEETEPRKAGLHQEILPKGRKSDLDTHATLTVGEQDSISRGDK